MDILPSKIKINWGVGQVGGLSKNIPVFNFYLFQKYFREMCMDVLEKI